MFEVVYPREPLEQFRDLAKKASRQGKFVEFQQVAEFIDDNLQSDPRSFGDPCYSYPSLKLDVFVRAVAPLVVYTACTAQKALCSSRNSRRFRILMGDRTEGVYGQNDDGS